ncbi:MAG TPA: alanine racemase, partial [Actinomycetota bacterium]
MTATRADRATETFRPTVAEIDLEAIRHNARAMHPPGSDLMAVVKADGYGHGGVESARAAVEAGATWLGVALLEEALELRRAGLDMPILILSEVPAGSEGEALRAGVTLALYSDGGLRRLAGAAGETGITPRVHVKADTGMHRVGRFPPEAVPAFVLEAISEGFDVDGIWTHFARSEDDARVTTAQLERFMAVCRELERAGIRPRWRHAANSGA